jgi:hypothetical protein
MNTAKIKLFINKNSQLFWYIKPDEKENISLDFLIETILNFGNEQNVKELFELIGIEHVAEIFHKQNQKQRTNYFPQVVNYFNLYFQKYVQKYPV